jgi:hypothetical protein
MAPLITRQRTIHTQNKRASPKIGETLCVYCTLSSAPDRIRAEGDRRSTCDLVLRRSQWQGPISAEIAYIRDFFRYSSVTFRRFPLD